MCRCAREVLSDPRVAYGIHYAFTKRKRMLSVFVEGFGFEYPNKDVRTGRKHENRLLKSKTFTTVEHLRKWDSDTFTHCKSNSYYCRE